MYGPVSLWPGFHAEDWLQFSFMLLVYEIAWLSKIFCPESIRINPSDGLIVEKSGPMLLLHQNTGLNAKQFIFKLHTTNRKLVLES